MLKSFVTSIVVLSTISALAIEPKPHNAAHRAAAEAMVCVSKLVNKKLGESDHYRKEAALNIIDSIHAGIVGQAAPQDYMRMKADCEAAIDMTREDYEQYVKNNSTKLSDAEVKEYERIFNIMRNVSGFCTTAQVAGNVAFALGVSATSGVAYCTSPTGKRWLQVSAGAGLGAGLAYAGSAGKVMMLSLKDGNLAGQSIVNLQGLAYGNSNGLVLGGPSAFQQPGVSGYENRLLTLGLQAGGTMNLNVNVKILPLLPNKTFILNFLTVDPNITLENRSEDNFFEGISVAD